MTQLLADVKWCTSSPITRAFCDLAHLALSCCLMYLACNSMRCWRTAFKSTENCLSCYKASPVEYLCWQGHSFCDGCCSQASQGFLETPPCWIGCLHEPLHSLDLSLNEAIALRVVWWWGGVFDTKIWKKGVKFFDAEGRAIVTHDFIWCAFQSEQFFQLVLDVGKAGWLGLKYEGKLAKLITYY